MSSTNYNSSIHRDQNFLSLFEFEIYRKISVSLTSPFPFMLRTGRSNLTIGLKGEHKANEWDEGCVRLCG